MRVAATAAAQCRSPGRRIERARAGSTIRTVKRGRKHNRKLKGWRDCLMSWQSQAGQMESRARACSDRVRLPRDMTPGTAGACLAGLRNVHFPSHPVGS